MTMDACKTVPGVPDPGLNYWRDPMNTVLRVVGITALVLASLGTTAQAGERGPKAKGGDVKSGKPMGPMAALNLTPEQKQKLDQIHEAAAKQADPLHKEVSAKMKEMEPLWLVEKPDRAAIERKHAEIAAVRTKLWGIHIDTRLQVHALLTPEQRAKWTSHGPMKEGMHGPGMMGMQGEDCPCAQGGDCPLSKAGGCPHAASCPCAKDGGCPGMHGPGPGMHPHGPGGPAKGPKPEKP
jgi:Spy/CpxP family protein refolding chaperone